MHGVSTTKTLCHGIHITAISHSPLMQIFPYHKRCILQAYIIIHNRPFQQFNHSIMNYTRSLHRLPVKSGLLITLLVMLFLHTTVLAQADQRFNEAIAHFEVGEYDDAIAILENLDSPEARLFLGKSFYNTAGYTAAGQVLSNLRTDPSLPEDIRHEAGLTFALTMLHSRNYGVAFDILDELHQSGYNRSVRDQANRYFNQFSRFLTVAERKNAVFSASRISAKSRLLNDGVRIHPSETAQRFVKMAELQLGSSHENEIQRIRQAATSNRVNATRLNPEGNLSAPEEITYNIGLILPQQDRQSDIFEVSRAIYFGVLLAIEQHNALGDAPNVILHHAHKEEDDEVEDLFHQLIWDHNIDAMIGPLFSEDAEVLAALANTYQIPLIAPLANSEILGKSNSFMFQANPTFRERGRAMARMAMERQGYRSFSVIVDENSLGMESAAAFSEEVLRRGGRLVHFFADNFRDRNFEVDDYTQYFSGNPELVDTTITLERFDALYMPFTGGGASTLIDMVITDLLRLSSPARVIGSSEFGLHSFSSNAVDRFRIIYPEVFRREEGSEAVRNFRSEYSARFGRDADLYSMIGFDNANYIIRTLNEVKNPALLANGLRNMEPWRGLNQLFDFQGGQVNLGIETIRLTRQGPEVIQP